MDPTVGLVLAAGISSVIGGISAWWVKSTSASAQKDTAKNQADLALLGWANALQASEKAAREEAEAARRRADQARDETEAQYQEMRKKIDDITDKLDAATGAVNRLTDILRMVESEVSRPEPSIPALRRLFAGRTNGSPGWTNS